MQESPLNPTEVLKADISYCITEMLWDVHLNPHIERSHHLVFMEIVLQEQNSSMIRLDLPHFFMLYLRLRV